jgi:hypothetical protein
MEGWRQWLARPERNPNDAPTQSRIHLTPTGLLMEGSYHSMTLRESRTRLFSGSMSVMAMLHQRFHRHPYAGHSIVAEELRLIAIDPPSYVG